MTDNEALRSLFEIQQKFQKKSQEQYKKYILDRKDADKYPWMIYWSFGWHDIQYLTDEEAKDLIKSYRLTEITVEGTRMFVRYGRQPITIIKRSTDD